VTVTLVAVHTYGYYSWSTRPVELEHRLDLNHATREELLQLPRVGDRTAERILDSRRRASFAAVEDLRKVHGVGPATVERLRPLVKVTDEEPEVLSKRSGASPAGTRLTSAAPVSGTKPAKLDRPININQAGAEELSSLPGIGAKRSAAIIAERDKGRFQSVDDLRRVPGIGKVTLEKLRPYVIVDGDTEESR
jgi:competence protein ComEA